MSVFLVWITADEPIECDDFASGLGWEELQDWAAHLDRRDWPNLSLFGETAECYETEDGAYGLDRLAREVDRAVATQPDGASDDVRSTLIRLLDFLRAPPQGALGVLVTDGTGPDDEADDPPT